MLAQRSIVLQRVFHIAAVSGLAECDAVQFLFHHFEYERLAGSVSLPLCSSQGATDWMAVLKPGAAGGDVPALLRMADRHLPTAVLLPKCSSKQHMRAVEGGRCQSL